MGSYKTRLKKGLSTEGACKVHLFPEWKLSIVANFIFKNFWKNRKSIINKAIKMLENAEGNKEKVDHSAEIEKLNNEKEKFQTKLNNLVEMRLEGDISKEIYEEKKRTIKNQIEYCESSISELTVGELGLNPTDFQKDSLEKLFMTEFHAIKGKVPDEMIETFIDRIVVHEDYFEWRLKRLDSTVQCRAIGNNKNKQLEILDEKSYKGYTPYRKLPLVSNALKGIKYINNELLYIRNDI